MTGPICIIGAGPAGLKAAEMAAGAGASVSVFDAMPSAGRKLLVAGRGGLNLTNTDKNMVENFSGFPPGLCKSLLEDFDAEALRRWAEELGVPTFSVPNGRVYPEKMKSAPLLRRWIARLKSQGVQFFHRHRWSSIRADARKWALQFETPAGCQTVMAGAVVFALGGGSWPGTGSDGTWQNAFRRMGVELNPLVAANCGWEVAWPEPVVADASGKPLKNIRGFAGEASAAMAFGELMITDYGLEGGVIYSLTPSLRASPLLHLDLKPSFSLEDLVSRMPQKGPFHMHEAFERCRLQATARTVLKHHADCQTWRTPTEFAKAIKSLPISLGSPRPIEEAISSAGGVKWCGVSADLMMKNFPGVFVAGEMLDWEAPTGGYLMQGCFSTGRRAGTEAARYYLHND